MLKRKLSSNKTSNKSYQSLESSTDESILTKELNSSTKYGDGPIENSNESHSWESTSFNQSETQLRKYNDEARNEIKKFNEECQPIVDFILEGKCVNKLYNIYLKKEKSKMWVDFHC